MGPVRLAVILACLLAGASPRAAGAATVPGNYATIQAAINAVVNGSLPNGSTIDVQPGTYNEALVIPPTTKSMTIRGVGGPGATVVDGRGLATVLIVYQATGAITIQGLTLRNGANPAADGGGFIFAESSPTVINCVVEASMAGAGGGGLLLNSAATFNQVTIRNNTALRTAGGVYIISGSRPVFTNVDILGNVAGAGGPGVGNTGVGGGIQSIDSFPTIRGSRINGNRSKFAGGGVYHIGRFGAPTGTAVIVIEDTEIADNITAPFSAADNPSEGGGMNVEDNSVARLRRVRVLRNRANTSGGLSVYRSRFDIVDSVIEGNTASARTDGGANGGIGGGITASSNNPAPPAHPPSVLNLTRTIVRGNVGVTGGGIVAIGDNYNNSLIATVTLTDSIVDGNQAQSQGGGLLMNRANLTMTNTMVTRNSVAGGSAPFGGGVLLTTRSAATITGSTIAQNTASSYGGGLFMDDNSQLQLNGSRLYENTAQAVGGGGLFVGQNGSNGGAVQNSVIADNTGHQVVEFRPCPATGLTYTNNVITPRTGNTDLFYSNCGGGLTTVGQFNATSAGRASGNTSGVPQFAHFLAAPTVGTPTTLAWSVARATSVTISGSPASAARTGSLDVWPGARTTYTLSASTPSGVVGVAPSPTIAVAAGGPPAVPSAPQGLSAIAVGSSLAVNWSAPASGGPVTRYIVMAGRGPGMSDLARTDLGGATSASVPVPNGVYYVRVAAENENGEGPPSAEVGVTVGPGVVPPSAPRNLSASASGNTLNVRWDPPTTGPVSRYVLRAGSRPGVYDIGAVDMGTAMAVSATMPIGTYYLQVVAENPNGQGPPSAEASVTVQGPILPSAPLSLQGSGANGTLALSWQAPSVGGPVATYVVQAGVIPGDYRIFNGPTGPATSVAAPVAAGTYYVRVRAQTAVGLGPFTPEIAVTVGPACNRPAPPVLTGSRSGNVLNLSWTAAAGVAPASYTLQFAAASAAATHQTLPMGTATAVSGAVAPGTYVLRVLAGVACGVSNPSNEVTIVVP